MTATGERLPVVVADDLSIEYRSNVAPGEFLAVRGVSFALGQGEILGLVGESGSGKSTLARAIAGLSGTGAPGNGVPRICGGSLSVLGRSLRHIGPHGRDRITLRVGHLAQNGAETLNSTFTVAENVAEPIYRRDRRFNTREAADAVAYLIDAVHLPLSVMDRMPWELSSGQRQRVALARALILEPVLLVADEPTRGVDAAVRDGVLEALRRLQAERDFSAIVVSSDLAVATAFGGRLAVMKDGILVGLGETEAMLDHPYDEYLKGLVRARDLAEHARHPKTRGDLR
ncbi:MAG: transporter ATP-binding protein [Microbacteriaceae bacterium]|nr:transporter ATP-binding protein [Microbacteriaceae bacterium]